MNPFNHIKIWLSFLIDLFQFVWIQINLSGLKHIVVDRNQIKHCTKHKPNMTEILTIISQNTEKAENTNRNRTEFGKR